MAKARKRKSSSPGLLDERGNGGPTVEAEESRRDAKGWRYGDLPCTVCGRLATTRWKGAQAPTSACCGRLWCTAMTSWTEDEWRARARVAALQPPVRLGPLRPAPYGRPCPLCEKPLNVYAVPTTADGHDRALGCGPCDRVFDMWAHQPLDGERVDVEVLKRFPGIADQVAVRLAELAQSAAEAQAQAVPTVDEGVAVLPASVHRGPVCQLVECNSEGWTAKCGRHERRTKKVQWLPDAAMTGWGAQVTCPACLCSARHQLAA